MTEELSFIIKDLAALKAEIPSNVMIGRIEFLFEVDHAEVNPQWQIKRRQTNEATYYLAKFTRSHCVRSVLLAPIVTAETKVSERINKSCEGQCFRKEEVLDFVDAIDDENPIHRDIVPVVPGLMILDSLLKNRRESIKLGRYYGGTIKFLKPLYGQETYELIGDKMIKQKTNEPVAHLLLEEK